MLITCPSGLAGEIRSLKVREENILADAKAMRNGEGMSRVLAAIWQSTTDPGPYKLKDDVPDWEKVLIGDHLYAAIQMRIATYGPSYSFKPQCQNQSCRSVFEWELRLDELPVQKLPEASIKAFQDGNRFRTKIASTGQDVTFHLLLANAQKRFLQVRQQLPDRMATAVLRLQVDEIEGVETGKLNDFLSDMDARDASLLRQDFDDAGCGIETGIKIECPTCLGMFDLELPLGGPSFFSVTRAPSKS
jgi:hypothetical protein